MKSNYKFYLTFILLLFSMQIFADWTSESVTMMVGQEKTLYLPYSVTSKTLRAAPQFYSPSISYVEITNYGYSSVRVLAKKATSTPVIVRCDYYYNVLQNGRWVYGFTGAHDFKITIKENNTDKKVTNITLNASSVSMTVGSTRQLVATITPSNATNKSVTWSSNSSSIASEIGRAHV